MRSPLRDIPTDMPTGMASVPSPEREAREVQAPGGDLPRRGVAFGSTPEELGALASSLQRGWLDSRADSAVEPDGS
jgi:hypothetical protein